MSVSEWYSISVGNVRARVWRRLPGLGKQQLLQESAAAVVLVLVASTICSCKYDTTRQGREGKSAYSAGSRVIASIGYMPHRDTGKRRKRRPIQWQWPYDSVPPWIGCSRTFGEEIVAVALAPTITTTVANKTVMRMVLLQWFNWLPSLG